MTTLVLGGTGFVGSRVVEAAQKREKVVATRDSRLGTSRANIRWVPYRAGEEIPASFLACERAVWTVWDEGKGPPLLGRFLATVPAGRAFFRHFVLVSSAAAKSRIPTPYGARKREEERLLLRAARSRGFEAVILRLHNLLGPGATRHNLVAEVLRRLREKEPLPPALSLPVGPADASRDWVDLRDAAEGILSAARRAPAGRYDLASGRSIRTDRLLAEIARIFSEERGIRLSFPPTLPLARGVLRSRGNPEPLRHATGWRPRHSFSETLRWLLAEEGLIPPPAG